MDNETLNIETNSKYVDILDTESEIDRLFTLHPHHIVALGNEKEFMELNKHNHNKTRR